MPKIVERTRVFALDDGACRVIGTVSPGASRLTIRCDPMPAARIADEVELHLAKSNIRGRAVIENVGEIGGRLDDDHVMLLVLRLLAPHEGHAPHEGQENQTNEQEVA